MAMTTAERRQKQIETAKAAQKRARDKAIAKMNDPIEQEKRREKQRAAAQRAYERAKEKARIAKPKPRKVKPIKSKGLKGRAPSAEEKRVMDLIGTLPCIACAQHGRHSPVISLHHTDGRTKPLAHMRVLPLCAHHHDTPADKAVIAQYPDLIPIHARGIVGGRAQWNAHNGLESQLLKVCFERLAIEWPDGFFLDMPIPNV